MSAQLFDLPGDEASRLELRPLQLRTLDLVREAWKSGAANVLVQAPCGFGKTEVATAMLMATFQKMRRGLFLCDRISLINQTSERFDRYGLPHGVEQADHTRMDRSRRVQLCSVQTLTRRGHWPETDVLFVDEAHIMGSFVKRRLEENKTHRKYRVVGLTATPFTKGLAKYFDVLVNAATTNELIREGWLTPFRIFSASQPDMR